MVQKTESGAKACCRAEREEGGTEWADRLGLIVQMGYKALFVCPCFSDLYQGCWRRQTLPDQEANGVSVLHLTHCTQIAMLAQCGSHRLSADTGAARAARPWYRCTDVPTRAT